MAARLRVMPMLSTRSLVSRKPGGQLAPELFGRDSRLILSLRVNDIANPLSLSKVNAPIEKGSKGELARLRYARSSVDHHPEYVPEDYRTTVTTDFYNIFACV